MTIHDALVAPRDDQARAPFHELGARTTGPVAVPGDERYDALVSPWNVAVPVRPAAVVAAQTADDVVEAVRFAIEHGLVVTPQATGHGPIAELVGELLVTTAGLDECVVHPEERWARVGAGVKWLQVVEAVAPYGLAPLSGSITDVGVVGYTTGGGLGPMARTYGLAIDRVRAIEVVTGDGVLRRATPTEAPDLFFALRGGKGMAGIVTAIEFDLVHQPEFYGGSLWFEGEHAATVIEQWRTWSAALPELATTSFALFQLPPMDGVPPELADRLTLSIRYVWTGDAAEGERRFAAMRAAAPVLLDDVDWRTPSRADLFLLTMAVRVMAPHALFVHSAHFSPTVRACHVPRDAAGRRTCSRKGRTTADRWSGAAPARGRRREARRPHPGGLGGRPQRDQRHPCEPKDPSRATIAAAGLMPAGGFVGLSGRHLAGWAPNVTNAFLYRIKTTTALNAPDGMVPIGFLQIKWRRYAGWLRACG
mgnify:CR=1 FL=1